MRLSFLGQGDLGMIFGEIGFQKKKKTRHAVSRYAVTGFAKNQTRDNDLTYNVSGLI